MTQEGLSSHAPAGHGGTARRQHLELHPPVQRVGGIVRAGADHVGLGPRARRDDMAAQGGGIGFQPVLHILGAYLRQLFIDHGGA